MLTVALFAFEVQRYCLSGSCEIRKSIGSPNPTEQENERGTDCANHCSMPIYDINFIETITSKSGVVESAASESGVVEPATSESGVVETAAAESGVVELATNESGVVEDATGESGVVEDATGESGVVEDAASESGVVESATGESGTSAAVVEVVTSESGITVEVADVTKSTKPNFTEKLKDAINTVVSKSGVTDRDTLTATSDFHDTNSDDTVEGRLFTDTKGHANNAANIFSQSSDRLIESNRPRLEPQETDKRRQVFHFRYINTEKSTSISIKTGAVDDTSIDSDISGTDEINPPASKSDDNSDRLTVAMKGSKSFPQSNTDSGDRSNQKGDTKSYKYPYCREDTSSPGPPHHHLERPSKDEAGTTLHTGKDLLSPLKEITSVSKDHTIRGEDEQTPQQDRCIEVYPETLRQRQRNMAPSPSKVDIKNWESATGGSDDDSKGGKKFLPSVKALRHQFENGRPSSRETSPPLCTHVSTMEATNKQGRTSSSSSTSSLTMSSLETSSGFGSLNSSQATVETSSTAASKVTTNDDIVEPIFRQFQPINDELKDLMSQPPSTAGWNPQILLKKLYYLPEVPKMQHHGTSYTNIEGYLEKLPSGRKKATFWNAWKRRYFAAKEGILYYYQSKETEKPNMKLPLMGGKVEIMDTNTISIDDGDKDVGSGSMLGIDDGKGHYVVVRCISRQEAERWKKALETHTVEDFSSQFVQPWPRPTNPTLLRDTIVIDIGSCSVRAGVLASQATLPQLFFPSVVTTNRESHNQIWGLEALTPEARTGACVAFPVRPSHKISKFSVDLNAVSGLLQKTFNDLKVDPKNYNIQMSVPRVLNPHTQAELLKILFDKFGVKAVNLTHQAILALYSYNATSGIVVDIGERIDVVPVTDGYIVDGGVSRVPYGGYRIMDHLRQFLFQRNLSLINEVDSYIIRQILETVCYCALHYNAEKQRCTMNPENFEKSADLTNFFPKAPQFEAFHNITLDFGRFQASEGLFNPDAWGLDHPGLHKLVHKAIQECSLDIRKEMSRSVFLAGGVSLLPGLNERLTVELDNLTPPAVRPKVHASPYRYHSAYIGACVLAESPAFIQSRITKEEWHKQGNSALRKWAL